jgi:hypothetical protein
VARSIKITADTSQLKKSITDLSKVLNKDMGRSKIELFSADTKKFLRTEAITNVENIKRKIDGMKTSTAGWLKNLQGVVKGSKEELTLKMKILSTSKAIVDAEKDQQEAIKLKDSLQQSAFSKQFQRMSGLTTIMDKIKGLGEGGGGMMGMAGGLLGMGSIAALAYGGSRVYAGRQTWKEGVQDRLSLQARTGTDQLEPQNARRMEEAGMDAQSMRAARLQAMDVFGAAGANEKSVVQRAGFERAHGIEQGTMTGIGAALRPSMGGAQANATVMKLQASLIASGIKDAIGPYLETAASMLTDLNEKGFTMDDSVLALFNQMTKTGMGEGRIKQLSMGVDQSIRGSTGESNAFFQSVFNKAGIGGGTIGGAQAAMRMGGLFGVDLSKYKGMSPNDKKMFESMGIGGTNSMQKVSGAILGQMDNLFKGQKGPQNRLSRLRYIMSTGMAKDEGQASEVEGLLRRAQKATPAEQKKIMARLNDIKDENKDPNLSELKKINSSTAGIYDVLQKTSKTQLDQLGEVTGGVFNDMDKLLTSIDGAILAIAKFFTGYKTPEEEKADQKEYETEATQKAEATKKRLLAPGGQLMSGEEQSLKDLPYDEKVALYSEKQKGFFRNTQYENVLNSGVLDAGEQGAKWQDKRKARGQSTEIVSHNHQKRMADSLDKIAKNTNVTARNTKNSGASLPAASSSTSGTGQ